MLVPVNKLFLFIISSLFFWPVASAQKQGKLELYQYIVNGMPASFQPSLHFQSSKNWSLEVRYNYEAPETFSLYTGKNYSGNQDFSYSITPMIGYSIGQFRGLSLAVNTDTEWKGFFLSSQAQYSMGIKTKQDNFLFSWTELGYDLSENFFAGISFQHTVEPGKTYFEPGLFAGISIGNIEIPLYLFNPFKMDRCFILGLSYEYKWKSKNE